jgi:hypothetical protein
MELSLFSIMKRKMNVNKPYCVILLAGGASFVGFNNRRGKHMHQATLYRVKAATSQ